MSKFWQRNSSSGRNLGLSRSRAARRRWLLSSRELIVLLQANGLESCFAAPIRTRQNWDDAFWQSITAENPVRQMVEKYAVTGSIPHWRHGLHRLAAAAA